VFFFHDLVVFNCLKNIYKLHRRSTQRRIGDVGSTEGFAQFRLLPLVFQHLALLNNFINLALANCGPPRRMAKAVVGSQNIQATQST
jgi:hypothetical protein